MTYSSAASPVCVWASASREEEAELCLTSGDGIKGGDFPVDRAASPDGKDTVIESTRPFSHVLSAATRQCRLHFHT